MRSGPTVTQLRAFVAVAQFQHFRDAAVSLGVSQPTLSQALSALEERLGLKLIERNPRRILVTPQGEHLLPLAKQAVDAVDAFHAAALPDTWLSGPLHVGVIPTVAPYLLPTLLPTLVKEAPDLQMHVHEDQTERLLAALAAGNLDVAVMAMPVDDPRMKVQGLYDEDYVLAVPPQHPWAESTTVAVLDLQDQPLLFLEKGHCLHDQAIGICLQSGVTTAGDTKARAASLSTIVQLVSAGLGMTFLPDTAVKVETRGAQLGVARFAEPAPSRRVCLVHRRSTTRAEEFEDFADIIRRGAASGMPMVRPV